MQVPQVLRRRGGPIDGQPGKAPALVASAARMNKSDFTTARRKSARMPWQADVWRHFDISGEFAYGVSWVANSLSRVKLYIAEGDTDIPEPKRVTSGPANDFLSALFSGPGGQSEMMRAMGQHLTVPGELYLVSYRDPDTKEEMWVTASTDEVTRNNRQQVTLDRGDGKTIELQDGRDFILRIWRSHARRWWLADSPGHHALPVLVELEALTKGVLATIDSRLAGSGILLIPNEFTFPPAANADPDMEPLTAALIEAMITPLQNPESAASVVPFVIRGAAEHMDKAKHLQFAQNLDTQITPLREAALRRLAISLDTPPEALMGMGASNHWCADAQTEILTSTGWRGYKELAPGDVVLTLNHEAGSTHWQAVTDVNTWDVVNEPMVSVESRLHSSLTTLNHRWPVLRGDPDGEHRVFTTSDELLEDDLIITGAPNPEWRAFAGYDTPDALSLTQKVGVMGRTTYTGVIWCPTTDNRTWLARRNGTIYFTGNSAWQISEDAVKLNIEPLCATICDALTTGYLWPLLGGPSEQTIWYDTSNLTQRPDRGPDAEAVFANRELSGLVYRRERGFSEDDKPSDRERLERLLTDIILKNPQYAGQLLPILGLTEPGQIVIAPPPALPPAPGEQPPEAEEPGGPPVTKPEGGEPPPASAVLLADGGPEPGMAMLLACEFAVHRALEVAGKRMLDRNLRNKYQDTPAWLLYTFIEVDEDKMDYVLSDAWTMFSVSAPEYAHLVPALDEYVRDLLSRGIQHDRSWLTDVLRMAVSGDGVLI